MKKILVTLLCILASISLFSKETSALSGSEKLTKNDQYLYEDLRYRLDARLQKQVTIAIDRYKVRIAQMDKIQANILTDGIIKKLDAVLYKIRAKQPLDKNREKVATDKYLAYMLVKFELLLLR